MNQTCERCGSVLLWAHGQLVCPRRGCGIVASARGGGVPPGPPQQQTGEDSPLVFAHAPYGFCEGFS